MQIDFMQAEYLDTLLRLLAALLAGGMIGLERSYNGRPAGFRTHSLVCMASSLLMLLTVYQWKLLADAPLETIRVDPTRMAQGIMTGIGFLGAGVIMKERLTIRGLTTAASIWITASIGVLIGMGYYFAGFAATILSLGILSLFRWFENRLPTLEFGRVTISTLRKDHLSEDEVIAVAKDLGMKISSRSYRLVEEGKQIKYEMIVFTRNKENFRKLSDALSSLEKVYEFNVAPGSN